MTVKFLKSILNKQNANIRTSTIYPKLPIFHHNIASMSKHFDELSTLFSLMHHKFSIIGITESRILKGHDPICDFSILGYSTLFIPTESSAGSVLLYISNSFDFKPRLDLDSSDYSKNFESVFVEIIVPNNSNIIVGTIYRHPCMAVSTFNSIF